MSEQLLNQVPIALVLVFIQNWLKQQKWFPLINYQTERLNHWFAVISSGLATVGIHVALNVQAHSLTITWPETAVLITMLYHWLVQYISTKTAYTLMKAQLNPQAAPQVIMGGSVNAGIGAASAAGK